jgi:acyl-Coa thioesterase superfamily protein/acyl-CoA thioesterase superfamily protein
MADTAPAFFVRTDENRFRATVFTRGPWDPKAQHAGPPAALLGYAIEHRPDARPDTRVTRIAFDILRPIPIGNLTVTTAARRSGRSTEFVDAELALDDGSVVMTARALLIRAEPGASPAAFHGTALPPPDGLPDETAAFPFDEGYHTGIVNRYAIGSFSEPGPAQVWFRMRHPLVLGEPIDALSRVLIAADSGNGVSQVFSPRDYLFVNPELTVHLHRYPDGEWICLDASSTITDDGIGLADTGLYDTGGQIGRGTQSLFVAKR